MTHQRASKWLSMVTGVLCFTLLGLSQGCHDADRYVLTSDASIPVDQLFMMTVQGDSVQKADGFSRIQLIAQVMDVSEGGRTILFTTTAGSLRVGDRSRSDSLLVETDLQGKAEVALQSPNEAAVAQITATIEGVTPTLTQQRNIRFTAVTAEDMLSFEGLPDRVVAGNTNVQTEIRVQIDESLEGEDRRVSFTTSIGRFLFGTGQGGRTREVLADQNGVATVTLESPDDGGEAVITATVRGFVLEETIQFFVPPKISFVTPPTTAPADGVTLTRFSALITSDLGSVENLSVEFVTTAGTLVSEDQEGQRITLSSINQDTVSVFLRSPRQVGAAAITATLEGGSTAERFVTFGIARPDSVLVSIDPTQIQLRPNDQTTIQAALIRNVGRGQVSEGLSVSFAASDSVGNAIPLARFFNVSRANSDGIATAIFTPDGSSYRGLATIRATYVDAEATVTGTATVRFVDE